MGAIGVLDSGIGGLILLQHLMERYPQQDFIFFADQIHSPYGNKTEDELIDIVNQNIAWLKEKNVDTILFACNTISCLNHERIDNSVLIQRVIEPTCRQLLSKGFSNVLVCSTVFTANSDAYAKMFQTLDPKINVITKGLPYLCSDVEHLTSDHIVYEKLELDLSCYKGHVDAVVLGCTHYPRYAHLFEKLLHVPVYDSNSIELMKSSIGSGTVEYWTTDDPSILNEQCLRLFHRQIHSCKVEL